LNIILNRQILSDEFRRYLRVIRSEINNEDL
jgi:hypothetical protein